MNTPTPSPAGNVACNRSIRSITWSTVRASLIVMVCAAFRIGPGRSSWRIV
ncbi:hypothetical protein ACFQ1I_37840 [Kitasatospora arboriphila]